MNHKKTALNCLLLSLLLLLQACAGTRANPQSAEEEEISAPQIEDQTVTTEPMPTGTSGELYGPPPAAPEASPAPSPSPSPSPSPTPVPDAPKAPKICVVLGPGMAKAIAEAGVLEVLGKAGLPINCVVGTEMGAVVGAIYAEANGGSNSLEWELFKFNKDNYFNFPIFSIRGAKSTGNKLHELFHEVFGHRKIEALHLQFATSGTDPSSGAVVPFLSGDINDALSASVAIPGVFDPWTLSDGRSLVSGAVSSPLPIDLATNLGATFIIGVSVIDDVGNQTVESDARFLHAFVPIRNLLRLQKKDVHELIEVHLSNVSYDDFSKQGEILAAGKSAAEKLVDHIKADWDAELAKWNTSPNQK